MSYITPDAADDLHENDFSAETKGA